MDQIGWIGLGNMGSRMAGRLIQSGYQLVVHDMDITKMDQFVEMGARKVGSPKEMLQHTSVIFTMIPNGTVLKNIVTNKNGLLEDASSETVLVDMSTVDPQASAEINEILETKQAKFLRATVTGSTTFAESGTLGIMVSGEMALFEKMLPIFKVLGSRQRYLGDKEQSRFMKICINMMIGTTMQMLAESLILGEKAGISWDSLIDCIVDSAAASTIIKAKELPLKKRDWEAMATSVMMEKDMNIAMELAATYGLALPVTALTRQMYAAMRSQGLGEIDYSGILLLNEKLNNLSKE